ncbi:MAG: alpha/beta fold hydrolase [Pseudomonadota bacterium]
MAHSSPVVLTTGEQTAQEKGRERDHTPPDGSIIWLHGLGADGHDFEPVVPELRLPAELTLRFVFPHAPVRPVTVNGGMEMRAWYDILSFDAEGRSDAEGVRDSSEILERLIQAEIDAGVAAERIVLAGFSQGGAIAAHVGLRYPEPLAGLMLLSTYLPLPSAFAAEVAANANSQPRTVPLFMAHGRFDPVLPLALGKESAEVIREAGFQVDWREYSMPHSVCPEEIADIRSFLLSVYGGL